MYIADSDQIRQAVDICQTPNEEVKLALYRVRVTIWNSRYAEAMGILLATLRRQGYDPDYPEQLNLRAPKTLDEVHGYAETLKDVNYDEDSDVRILLSTLICQSP